MKVFYYNGSFVSADSACIQATDRGFLLGDGVFDTLLAIDGQPQSHQAHFDRLSRHAALMGLPVPGLDFADSVKDLLSRSGYTKGRHAVRTTLTRGSGPRGLAVPNEVSPLLMIGASPVPDFKPEIKVILSRSVRRNEGSPLSRIKSLNYGDSVLAMQEAQQANADDAVLLNNRGEVCCLTASNIFIREQGKYVTPALPCGVLDGIGRGAMIASGEAAEDVITQERLLLASEIYCLNSLTELRRVYLVQH